MSDRQPETRRRLCITCSPVGSRRPVSQHLHHRVAEAEVDGANFPASLFVLANGDLQVQFGDTRLHGGADQKLCFFWLSSLSDASAL